MQQRKIEISVGAFLLVAITALAFLAIQVSGLSLVDIHRETYSISAEFNNVSGLKRRAKVTIAGVTVGEVSGMRLDPLNVRAEVHMTIDQDVDYLTTDSIASIKTSGILGEKYVSISVGGAPDVLTDGDTIRDTQSSIVLEDLLGKFVSGFN